LPVALRHQFASSLSWLHERHSQGLVRPHKVIIASPPLKVGQKLWSLLGSRPGATCQRGYCMSNGQIHPLDKGGVQPSREAQPLQGDSENGLCPQTHHV
jgi:hypothetical protein